MIVMKLILWYKRLIISKNIFSLKYTSMDNVCLLSLCYVDCKSILDNLINNFWLS